MRSGKHRQGRELQNLLPWEGPLELGTAVPTRVALATLRQASAGFLAGERGPSVYCAQ